MASASKSVTITFSSEGGGSVDPKDVVLTIKNWCTDAIVAGASVTLDGSTTMVSDVNGKVTFPLVEPGSHTLKITATGYLDSDTDTLANDSVTV